MAEDTTDVKVARLEVRMDALRTDMTDVKRTLAGQDDKLDKLLAESLKRQGARAATKVLMGVMSSSGFIAGLGWAWEHFHKP